MTGSVRRGSLAILAAKLLFIVAGYALYFGLGRLLTTEEFGVYGVVFGVVSLVNMVVLNGTMQGVSRHVAESPGREGAIRRRTLVIVAGFAAIFVVSYLISAPLIASLLHDSNLTKHLRLAVLIPLAYLFYAVNVGYLNGRQEFVQQASLDISFSLLKVSSILVLVALGLGIQGVILGFAGAAAFVLALSFGVAGRDFGGKEGVDLPVPTFLRFAGSLVVVALLQNAFLNFDLLLLKRLSPPSTADTVAGWYTAAQSIARLPYYLLVTASLVLFPLVARLAGEDEETRQKRADVSTRALSMLVGITAGMVALTLPMAREVLLVLYPDRYAEGAPILAVLLAGLALFSLVNVAVAVMTGAGRTGAALRCLSLGLAVQAIAVVVLVPRLGPVGAAFGTLVGALATTLLSGFFLARDFGTRLPIRVVLVVAGASTLAASSSWLWSSAFPSAGKLLHIAYLGVGFGGYLLLLLMGGVLLGLGADRSRVLLVTKPLEEPWNDGSKVLLRDVVRAMDPRRIAILTTALGAKSPDWSPGLERVPAWRSAETFAPRGGENLRLFLHLLLHRHGYAALHFFFAPSPASSWAIRFLRAVSPGLPVIQTVLSRPRAMEGASALLFGDVVTVGSDHTRRALQSAGAKRELLVVRPGIVSVEETQDRGRVLERFHLDPKEIHLLFAGDVDEGGAVPHLEVILPTLLQAESRVHVHFSIRRKGPETESIVLDFYRRILESWGERATLHWDASPFSDLLDLQDAMLFPAENLVAKLDAPLVVLETMARGRPAFVLNRGPLAEIIPEGCKEFLVSKDDTEMVSQVLAWIRDPALVPSEPLRNWIATTFHVQRCAKEWRAVHDQLRRQ